MHTSNMNLKVVCARGEGSREVVLDWVRTGSRIYGLRIPDASGNSDLRGPSVLRVEEDGILACKEMWN